MINVKFCSECEIQKARVKRSGDGGGVQTPCHDHRCMTIDRPRGGGYTLHARPCSLMTVDTRGGGGGANRNLPAHLTSLAANAASPVG